MRTRLRLFQDWGIQFAPPAERPQKAMRSVAYAGRKELIQAVSKAHRKQTWQYVPEVSQNDDALQMPEEPLPDKEGKNSHKAHRSPYNLGSQGESP